MNKLFSVPQATTGFTALFIDFENIFYFLKSQFHNPPELDNYAFEILRNLRERLEEEYGLQAIIMKAYADFERLGTPAQGSLYLMGIDTHNVMGTEHKNAADMRLCIDALEVLYTRPEIQTFVFVAGDRDYIPVIQHLKRQARNVLASAFRENVSGDLLQNIGKNQFIDAIEMLSEESRNKLQKRRVDQSEQKEKAELLRIKGLPVFNRTYGTKPDAEPVKEETEVLEATKDTIISPAPPVVKVAAPHVVKPALVDFSDTETDTFQKPATFEGIQLLQKEDEIKCLEFIMENLGRRNELWMGPFLRRLNDLFPLLADYERKMLLDRLTQAGAIRIEKRPGEPYDFTVMLVNYNHPDVRKLNRG